MNPTRVQRRAVAQLPDLTDLIIVGVRSGLSLTAAFVQGVDQLQEPLRGLLAATEHQLARGERLADALAGLTERLGPDAATFADTTANADRYGLPLEPVLERLAADSREGRRRIADRYARTLPVRLSFPLVLCTLPSFVLCAIAPALLGALSDLRGLTP